MIVAFKPNRNYRCYGLGIRFRSEMTNTSEMVWVSGSRNRALLVNAGMNYSEIPE
jgi:hypothetical protein